MKDLLALTAAEVDALPEAEAAEVLDAWVRAKKTELPEALARTGRKSHARLARKALYRLKSSGVEVVEAKDAVEPRVTEAAGPAPLDDADFPAVMTAMTGTGEFGVFFARAARSGIEAVQGVISDEQGVLQLESVEASRGAYRKRIKALDVPGATPVLRVPVARVLAELGHAVGLNQASGNALTIDLQTLVQRLGVVPQQRQLEIPAPDETDLAIAPAAASLHADPNIAEWLPSATALEALAARAAPVRSNASLDAGQKAVQLKQFATEAAKAYFTPEVRKRYASRLWFMAELFQANNHPGQAELARGEARRLFHTQGPTFFGLRLFTKAIELMEKAQTDQQSAAQALAGRPGALTPPPGR